MVHHDSQEGIKLASNDRIVQTLVRLVDEKKSTSVMLTEAEQSSGIAAVIDVNDYSSLQRLVRMTAWVRRFIDNARGSAKDNEKSAGRLGMDELKRAEIEWLKSVQNDLRKQGNFKQIVSELDIKEDRNVLRCGGRLVNSDLEIDARKPVILPRQHRFTKLVIKISKSGYYKGETSSPFSGQFKNFILWRF